MNTLEPFKKTTTSFKDERGEFSPLIIVNGIEFNLYQVNTVSTDKPYTFRGMHWQEPPYEQAKIIRCLFGNIIDFVIDIRVGSPNYGKSYSFTLNDKNTWLYVPSGFAHGYLTLPHNLGSTYPTLVEYFVNNEYNKDSERGIVLTTDIINIINKELPMGTELIINDRDLSWPTINEINSNFKYESDKQ